MAPQGTKLKVLLDFSQYEIEKKIDYKVQIINNNCHNDSSSSNGNRSNCIIKNKLECPNCSDIIDIEFQLVEDFVADGDLNDDFWDNLIEEDDLSQNNGNENEINCSENETIGWNFLDHGPLSPLLASPMQEVLHEEIVQTQPIEERDCFQANDGLPNSINNDNERNDNLLEYEVEEKRRHTEESSQLNEIIEDDQEEDDDETDDADNETVISLSDSDETCSTMSLLDLRYQQELEDVVGLVNYRDPVQESTVEEESQTSSSSLIYEEFNVVDVGSDPCMATGNVMMNHEKNQSHEINTSMTESTLQQYDQTNHLTNGGLAVIEEVTFTESINDTNSLLPSENIDRTRPSTSNTNSPVQYIVIKTTSPSTSTNKTSQYLLVPFNVSPSNHNGTTLFAKPVVTEEQSESPITTTKMKAITSSQAVNEESSSISKDDNMKSQPRSTRAHISTIRYRKCPCQRLYKVERCFLEHMEQYHPGFPLEDCETVIRHITTDTDASEYSNTSRHGRPIHRCNTCDKIYWSRRSYRRHMVLFHPSEAEKLNFKAKTYACLMCDKIYFTSLLLKQHMQLHNNPDHFRCGMCRKSYTTQNNLKRHIDAIHNKLRPFICEVCGSSFSQRYSLRLHNEEVHGKEKAKYICHDCGKTYGTKDKLKFHIKWAHQGYGKKECKLCNKIYLINNYKRHMRDVHKQGDQLEYPCRYCNKVFNRKAYRDIHECQHTGERKFGCHLCSARYTDPGTRYWHVRKMHPMEFLKKEKRLLNNGKNMEVIV